jgi:lipoprotein-anchoring transpeptidase ErfK/SrfK
VKAAAPARPAPRHRGAADAVPSDAWAELADGERAMASGYEQRFPMHGIAFHLQAQVFSEPSARGEVIGYLRRGTRVRASAGRSGSGCDRAWHELETGGFVCAGRGFVFGSAPQTFEPSPIAPALQDALPYPYAKTVAKSALQYWRIPTADEELSAQKLLASAPAELVHSAETSTDPAAAAALQLPDFARMPMEPGFYVSVDRTELDGTRAFLRTVRGAYVPAAAMTAVATPAAPGVVLGAGLDLPLGIALRGNVKIMQRDALGAGLQPDIILPRFSAVALRDVTAQPVRGYLETQAGTFVPEQAVRVAARVARPPLVPKGARWIHVDLAHQTLVAYEGARPVFATLVSSGKEGFETPSGLFRIFAKHVSTTMDGLAGSEDAYSIEDVPWTMYFQGNYALHAAFWHDRYGNVRSHGCVNLAPADARWLFRWAGPELPDGWHGVQATRDNPGAFVYIQ